MKQSALVLVKIPITIGIMTIFLLVGAFVWFTASDIRHLAVALVTIYFLVWLLCALFSNVPKEELRKRFVLTSVTIVFCLLLVEMPAWQGFVDYRHVFSTPSSVWWDKPGYAVDNELLWIHEPHHRLREKYSGNKGLYVCLSPNSAHEEYDLRYDQNGFRNDTDLLKADVAIIGDSYVESPMVPSSVLMTSVLAELQKETVANLGLSGYGPQQELAVLKRYALKLRPKTIVWVFYEGNDLSDVYTYKERLAWLPHHGHPRWLRSFTRNALMGLLRLPQLIQGCMPLPQVEKNYGTILVSERRRVYFLDDDSLILSPKEIEALNITGSLLAEAYRLCQERGIRFMVVFAPSENRVYHGLPSLTEASEAVKQWSLNDLPERLHTMVTDISPNIDYLDLTPIFKAETEKGTLVFLPDDTHWTPAGHRIVAQALHKLSTDRSFVVKQPEQLEQYSALMVRASDGTIRYWSREAEQLYGWSPKDALGKSSHRLLNTTFPKPLPSIDAELLKKGHWEGELVHKRRDGSQVIVSSHWKLQRNSPNRSLEVVEINSLRKRDG